MEWILRNQATAVILHHGRARNENLEQDLAVQEFSVNLFEGFDGRAEDFKPEDFCDYRFLRHQKAMTNAEVACALGHKGIYERFKESGLLLVFEDDCEIDSEFLKVWQAIETGFSASSSPIVISFYTEEKNPTLTSKTISTEILDLEVRRHLLPPSSAVCYAINSAAMKILSRNNKVTGRADWPPEAFAISFYSVEPFPIRHGLHNSTIIIRENASQKVQKPYPKKLVLKYEKVLGWQQIKLYVSLLGWKSYLSRVLFPTIIIDLIWLGRRVGFGVRSS